MSGAERLHPSHVTRISIDASSYDEICITCGATDHIGGWGALAEPCPKVPPDAAGMFIRGLLGLCQIVASRPDCPADIREVLRTNHRYIDALAFAAAPKPEKTQEVREPSMARVCPASDTICPQGMGCPYHIDRYRCDIEGSRAPLRTGYEGGGI